MYNRKVNQTVFNKVAKGQIPVDPAGYWNSENWGKPVIIPSNTVTGIGINQPLIGIDNLGTVKPIFPGQPLIKFRGDIVMELPIIPKKQVDSGWAVNSTGIGKPIPWPMTDSGRPSASYYNRMRGLAPGLFINGGEMELTDEEIEEYKRDGYIVEYLDDPSIPKLPKAQMGVIGQQGRKGNVYPFLSYKVGDSYPTAGVEYIKGFPTRDRRLKHSGAVGIYGSPEKIGAGLRYSSNYGEPNKLFNTLFDAYGGYGTDQGFYTGVGAYPMFNIVDRKDASFSAGPYLGYEMQTKLPQGIVNTMQSTGDAYFADPQSLPLGERLPLSSGFRYGAGAQGRFKDFYGNLKFWLDPVQGKLSDPTSDNPIIKTYQEKVGTDQVHFKPSFEISAGYNIPIDAGKSKIKKQIEERKAREKFEEELKEIRDTKIENKDSEIDFVRDADLKKKMLNLENRRYRFQNGGFKEKDRLKQKLLNRYPGFKKALGTEGENLHIVADPNFKANEYGYGNIEVMFPNTNQINYTSDYTYTSPFPGDYVISYNPNSNINKGDVFLDMLHILKNSEEAQPYLEMFKTAALDQRGDDLMWDWEDEKQNPDFINALKSSGGEDVFKQFEKNYIDGLLRSELSKKGMGRRTSDKGYNIERKSNSPEMRKAAKHIYKFLKTKQDGGYIELELTDDEIEQYVKGGYIVEELPKHQTKGIVDPSKMKRRTSLLDKYDIDPALTLPKPEVAESTKPKNYIPPKNTAANAVKETKQARDVGAQMIMENPSLSDEQKYEMVTSPQKSLDYYNTVSTFAENQGTIKRDANRQSETERLLDYAVHPADAFWYYMRGESFPENYREMRLAGIDPIAEYENPFKPSGGSNAVFRAVDAVTNPTGAFDSAYRNISEGNLAGAALDIAVIAPFMKALRLEKDAARLFKGKPKTPASKAVKSKPSQWDNEYIPPSEMGYNPLSRFKASSSNVSDEVVNTSKYIKKAPESNFKSEIDWGKWNKEIPENKALMDEYLAIEQQAKANGTWMKNPDGSRFKGTPEQFVQQNSDNFKKAFPNIVKQEGNITPLIHHSPKKFNYFDESKKLSGVGMSKHGEGIYTIPQPYFDRYVTKSFKEMIDPNTTKKVTISYGDNRYDLYANSPGVTLHPLKGSYETKPLTYNTNYKTDPFTALVPYSNRVKSAVGNNGMFDMTNPNIYKALVPAAIATGAAASSSEYKQGGAIEMELSPEEIEEYVKGGYIVEELPKAQEGRENSLYQDQLTVYNNYQPLVKAFNNPNMSWEGDYYKWNRMNQAFLDENKEALDRIQKATGKNPFFDAERIPHKTMDYTMAIINKPTMQKPKTFQNMGSLPIKTFSTEPEIVKTNPLNKEYPVPKPLELAYRSQTIIDPSGKTTIKSVPYAAKDKGQWDLMDTPRVIDLRDKGGEIMELTPEEIQWYTDNGYVVEEI